MSLLCLVLTVIGFGANDSIQKNKNHAITISFEFAPVSHLKWYFPEHKTVVSYPEDPPVDYTQKNVLLPICGMHVDYSFNETVKIETAISYSKEEVHAIFFYDTINSNKVSRGLGIYISQFVQIPIIINFRIPDNEKKRSYTNLKSGFNFDFIYYEKNLNGIENITPLNGSFGSGKRLDQDYRSGKYSFNKITPFIFIGREHYNKRANFSFSYGSMFTFKSIYQKHNTVEYFKNYKITPVIIGIAYNF